MTILFLSNNAVSDNLYFWLQNKEKNVIYCSEKLTYSYVKNLSPDFIISYNYKYIIKDDIISLMNGKIINLHISLLPWNRGASPNFWSFIDNTPKGVTIHYIDVGLDTGDIIIQKELFFDEKTETLRSTYDKLHEEIYGLFIEVWDKIKSDTCARTPQNSLIKGSYHNKSDFENKIKFINFSWDDTIFELKKKFL